MGFVEDFKGFAMKGNVVDLAVGVIIGGAFGKIVAAMVSDIIMPVVALVIPGGDWRNAGITLSKTIGPDGKEVANVIRIGDFLGAVLDFVIVALVIFVVVNKLMKAFDRKPVVTLPATPTTRQCAECLETIPLAARRCRACTAVQATLVTPGV